MSSNDSEYPHLLARGDALAYLLWDFKVALVAPRDYWDHYGRGPKGIVNAYKDRLEITVFDDIGFPELADHPCMTRAFG